MARIRLHVAQSLRTQPQEVVDAQGTRITLPFLRVFGLLRIGRGTRYVHDCIIDIGAPLTVFPRSHWQHFARDVEWLSPVGASPGSWLTNVYGRTGGRGLCRVGRVDVGALDVFQPRQELASVPVIAQFEQTPAATTASSWACTRASCKTAASAPTRTARTPGSRIVD